MNFQSGNFKLYTEEIKIDECFDYVFTSRYMILLEKHLRNVKQDRVAANSHLLSLTLIFV